MKKVIKKQQHSFSVLIEKDEHGYFIGKVPSLKSCYTQAKTLPELYKRLDEVVALSLEMEKKLFGQNIKSNEFIGIQKIDFVFN